MSYPRIPWWQPQIAGTEAERIAEVLNDCFLNEGKRAEAFSAEIARRLSVSYAAPAPSGTAAIFLALRACGVGEGDEVLIPNLTFIATANAVRLAGARPVLVDVRRSDLLLDPRLLERHVTSRTKAVIPVHISGRAAPMSEITGFARDRGLAVIEDAAEALGSRSEGRFLGTWGDAGVLSFSPQKIITTGQGGMVLTAREDVYRRLIELKDHGRPKRGTGGDDEHVSLGFNFKLTDLQAAVGLAQLERLDERTERLRRHHRLYLERLSGLPQLRLHRCDVAEGAVPLWTDGLFSHRNALDAFLLDRGAECRRFWHPLHTQAPYRQDAAGLSVSARLSPMALWLPSAFTLNDADIEQVCAWIVDFYRQYPEVDQELAHPDRAQ
jgi:perosamine synthetase